MWGGWKDVEKSYFLVRIRRQNTAINTTVNNGRNHQHTVQAILNMNDKIISRPIRTIIIPNKIKKTRPKPAKHSSNPCPLSQFDSFNTEICFCPRWLSINTLTHNSPMNQHRTVLLNHNSPFPPIQKWPCMSTIINHTITNQYEGCFIRFRPAIFLNKS